jgi:hypothetical protein
VIGLIVGVAPCPAQAFAGAVDVAETLDGAKLAAEVSVLEVRFATWRGFGHTGRVRVRVTSDPRRIFRGHALLGRTLDLSPCPFGPQSSTAELGRHVDDREPLFLVADDNGAIWLAGARHGEGYRLRTWSDLDLKDVHLQVPSGLGRTVESGARIDIPCAALDLRYGKARREFWGRVARFLSEEKPDAGAAELDRWIARLSASDHGQRRRAQLWIRRHACLRITELRLALAGAPDPETARNLREVLDDLADFSRAHDLAEELAGTPPDTRAAIVREGIPSLDGFARACADAYLRRVNAEGRESAPQAPR